MVILSQDSSGDLPVFGLGLSTGTYRYFNSNLYYFPGRTSRM